MVREGVCCPPVVYHFCTEYSAKFLHLWEKDKYCNKLSHACLDDPLHGALCADCAVRVSNFVPAKEAS